MSEADVDGARQCSALGYVNQIDSTPSLLTVNRCLPSISPFATANTTYTPFAQRAASAQPHTIANSNVLMSAATSLPQHTLAESLNSRSIQIGEWSITASTNPISNAPECDALQATLQGMPLPEMTFGNNSLELVHRASDWKYSFETEDALKAVKNGELVEGDGGVKVGYADAWLSSRYVPILYP